MYISVIVPVYNEKETAVRSLERLKQVLSESFEKYEIIAVDDGSTDGTLSLLAEENVTLISLGKNRGKGAAVRAGMKYAEGDWAFFTDCDLSYDPEFFAANRPLFTKCDIIIGERNGKYPVMRKICSCAYNSAAKTLLGIKARDIQCGIKGFDKKAYKTLFSESTTDGFAFDTEILMLAEKNGFSVIQKPAAMSHRKGSGVRLRSALRMALDIVKMRAEK